MDLVLSWGWLAIVASLIWRAFRQQRLLRVVGPVAATAGDRIPRVAIIIPMRNEAANIGACLDGMLNQDYPRAQQAPVGNDATATGQFMLIERDAYEAVGGHAAVCSAICEDLQLARLIKRSGGNVVLAGGERLLATRMYSGWRKLWPGLAKNVVDTLGGPLATATSALAAMALAWSAVLIPVIEASRCAQDLQQACFATAIAGTATLGLLALHLAATAHFRIPLWYGLVFPLGYTAGALIALDGLRRRLGGHVSWKGRTYP